MQRQKGFSIFETLLLLAVFLGVGAIGNYVWHHKPGMSASSECVSWVKKIEGKAYSSINKLDCSLKNRKIANSNLTAKYLEYSGQAKGGCPIDPGFYGQGPPPGCTSWSGIVLSNGAVYEGLSGQDRGFPQHVDYCYDYANDGNAKLKPTIHDLYFYKSKLYDRDVFKRVDVKTQFGDCVFNDTTIYRPSEANGANVTYITNVKVDYKNFPKDCLKVTIGLSTDDAFKCIDLATAANANLDNCYSNKESIVKNGKITGYKEVHYQSIQGDCEEVYAYRMAALNRCQDSLITKFQATTSPYLCTKWVTNPSDYTTRITTPI